MEMWEILIPKYSNDGEQYTAAHCNEWKENILLITKGLTELNPVKGYWINKKTKYIEDMIPIRVLCDETNIEKIIEETITHFDQEAVLAYVISNNIKLR